MSNKFKAVTIRDAKVISEKSGFPEVIIFAYDLASGKQHVTTYGKTQAQCEDAARAGNYLKRLLGWPEELCNAKPARQKRKEKKMEGET